MGIGGLMMLRRKRGALSLPFVVTIVGAIVLFASILNNMKNNLAVRNFESVTDLAAVETLRAAVDEKALANERLSIDVDLDGVETPEDMDLIRDEFISRVRDITLKNTPYAIRVEIPNVDASGNPYAPSDWSSGVFVNSQSSPTSGEGHFGMKSGDESRYGYFLGGTDTMNSAMSVVCDRTNLVTSGVKEKQSYIMTAKVMIIYKAMPLLNKFEHQNVSYTDIFSDSVTVISTARLGPDINAVTLQVIGKVTLR